jgi:hypothetical protein
VKTLLITTLCVLIDSEMRIAFLIATLALGLRIGLSAHATVNEYQEQQADRFCQVNSNYCNPD